jgi:hypothetical protein
MRGTSQAESKPWWWDIVSQWNRADGNELSWALASWLNLIYPDLICYLVLYRVATATTVVLAAICVQATSSAKDAIFTVIAPMALSLVSLMSRMTALPCASALLSSSMGSASSPSPMTWMPQSTCSAPSPLPPTPARWHPKGYNFSSMEPRHRTMVSSRSLVVLPESIPDCGLMTAEVEPKPLDTKLSST